MQRLDSSCCKTKQEIKLPVPQVSTTAQTLSALIYVYLFAFLFFAPIPATHHISHCAISVTCRRERRMIPLWEKREHQWWRKKREEKKSWVQDHSLEDDLPDMVPHSLDWFIFSKKGETKSHLLLLLMLLNEISLTYSENRKAAPQFTCGHYFSTSVLLRWKIVCRWWWRWAWLTSSSSSSKKERSDWKAAKKRKQISSIKMPRAERGGRFVYLSASPSPSPAKLLHCACVCERVHS